MSLDPEYYSGVAPFGSPDYYALLFCPPEKREALRVLLAFENILAQVSRQTVETSVRQAKLGWWAAELDRLSADEPRHPVASATHAILVSKGLSAAPLLTLFTAIVRESSDDLPRTPTELLEHAGDRGAIVSLIAGALGEGRLLADAELSAFEQLGRARFVALVLGDGHQHASGHHATAESAAMLGQLAARQRTELGSALEKIPAQNLTQFAPLLVMAGLLNRRLEAMARGGHIDSSSNLSCLLVAWRNARRANHGKLPI